MQELDATVNALLGSLLAASPAAVAASKDLIRAVARAPIDQAMVADTAMRITAARASPDGKEGVRSFLEKRKPVWAEIETQEGKAANVPKTKPKKSKAGKR